MSILALLLLATHYVAPHGSAAPEADNALRPWQLVEAAVAALPGEGGTVLIRPGIYRETFVLKHAAHLIAPAGGVRIGDLHTDVVATTTFNVLTWNTHLGGDEKFMPHWDDAPRAIGIGQFLGVTHAAIDLVSLCEVWDQDLLNDEGANSIQLLAGYANAVHGSHVAQQSEGCALGYFPTVMNSGLAMMSDLRLAEFVQVRFKDCYGSCITDSSPDCLANKGFIAVTVAKDGFTLRVLNTHTQADNARRAVRARQNQLVQLAEYIDAYRKANPTHAVLLMGDMNTIGESDQHAFAVEKFAAVDGHDSARNAANVSMYQNPRVADTLTSFNPLALHFERQRLLKILGLQPVLPRPQIVGIGPVDRVAKQEDQRKWQNELKFEKPKTQH